MTTYYIFRHGQTKYSKYHLPYPKDNRFVEILPEGRAAIERLGKYLKNIKFSKNFSSEYHRCQQTTEIVNKFSGLKFKKDKRLNEKSGENFGDFKARVKDFVEEIEKKNFETVVICTHGAVIAAMRKMLLKKGLRITNLPFYPKTGVLMKVVGKEIEYIDFN